MLRVGVLVSGGGTNLQAIIDAVKSGDITNASIEVVISNKKDAYALTRAKGNGIAAESVCIKDFEMSTNNQYFDYFSVFKETFSTHLLKQGGLSWQNQ